MEHPAAVVEGGGRRFVDVLRSVGEVLGGDGALLVGGVV